jgi:hypothetical protein
MTADPGPEQRESLGELLRGWSDLVRQVERGYEFSIYDYTNDLSVRDRLERVVAGASPQHQRALADADRRFTAATEESPRPLSTSKTSWWWRRVPLRRVGELAEDLESL